MYYRLKDDYVLRGYHGANCMLIQRPHNTCRALTSLEFKILMLCDGVTPFDALPMTCDEQNELQQMVRRGVITASDAPCPLSEDQLYQRYNNRFVHSIFWSITGGCNFRCRHCFMDAPTAALGEMSHEEAMHLIDEMAECGVLTVDITGGEPFIRKDFWQLIDHMLEYKINIRLIYTNGWLLNEKVLDAFESRNLRPEFSISFDGLGWHDWMRGVQGAEKHVLNVFKLLKKRGFPCNVEMCIHKGNLSVMHETILRLAELGVPAIKTSNVSPTALWLRNSEGYAMTDQEYVEAMIEHIPHFYEDGMPCTVMHSSVIELKRGKTEYRVLPEHVGGSEQECLNCLLCGAVRAHCYISPEGRLLPCMPMTACDEQNQFPLVQDIGLKAGLNDGFYMKIASSRVKDLLAANQECNSCPHKLKCGGGCRARALQETHDLMGSDPMFCMLWNGGYVERIRQAADAAIAKFCSPTETEVLS